MAKARDDEPTMLVDEDGKPLSDDPKSPPVLAKAAPDRRLRDKDGKLLSDLDPKSPPVQVKAPKRMRDLYKKDDSE